MKVSILIVNWNTREHLARCVEAILQNKPPVSFEVIVVDNNSTDGSAAMLRERFGNDSRIRIMESGTNLGFAKANNLAFRQSSGEYIFLLNPDTEVRGQAIMDLVAYLDRHAEVGAVGPRLRNPDGSLQPSVRRFPTFFASLLVLSGLHRFIRPTRYFMDDLDYSQEAEVDQVMGAAFMTRRSVIEKLGLFDEFFWLWYEEVDFCKRVYDAGYKIYYYPQAVVMHRGAESFSQLDVFSRKRAAGRSLVYYFWKNGSRLAALAMYLAVAILLGVALLPAAAQKLFGIKSRPHGV
ncbi:MAG: glycosyltransferase family 2 protein [Candidatus Doudnabacteria bacterium]|nr:glycosyltransferase family 2 protein [Candidatus Doudnabacteria bacterium]